MRFDLSDLRDNLLIHPAVPGNLRCCPVFEYGPVRVARQYDFMPRTACQIMYAIMPNLK